MAQQEDQERTAGAALTEPRWRGIWKSWRKKAVLLERLRCIDEYREISSMAKRNPLRSGQCHSMAGPLAGSGTHAPDGEPAALPHQRAAGPLEAVGLPSAHLAVLGGGRPAGTASGGIPAAAGSGQGPGKPARVLSCKGVRLPGAQCPRAAFADGGGGGQRLGTSGGRAAQVPPPLPATGIGRVHPGHGNPRGAGVYHPVGEAHEAAPASPRPFSTWQKAPAWSRKSATHAACGSCI